MVFIDSLDAQYQVYRKILEQVFAETATPNSDFVPEGQFGPYAIIPMPHEANDLTIPEHQDKTVEILEAFVRKRICMEEYIMDRPLTGEERAMIESHKEEFIARIRNPMAEHHGDYDHVFTLPQKLYTPELLPRWKEFALGLEETKGTEFKVSADEAAVALSEWTGMPWHIVLMQHEGFKQLRVETQNDVENTNAVAQEIQQALGMPRKSVFPLGKKLFIPVSFVTPEQLSMMRAEGLHPTISTLTDPQGPARSPFSG